jgi:hypothetical protein
VYSNEKGGARSLATGYFGPNDPVISVENIGYYDIKKNLIHGE